MTYLLHASEDFLMEPVRYTRFPDLSPLRPIVATDDVSPNSIDFLVQASLDVLVIAWAIVLRCYTEEATPTFRINGDSVTVDVLSEASPEVIHMTAVEGERYTGIFTEGESILKGFDVVLRYDEKGLESSLVCSLPMTTKQLRHISEQLVYVVQQRTGSPGHVFSWQGMPDLELSIINKAPRRLVGPDLLHHLINRHEDSDACAIEFRRPDGKSQTVSYTELHNRSSILAAQIRGILQTSKPVDDQKQSIIPLLVPQCMDLYIVILAILKAGAAFCPLHLDTPPERLRFIAGDVAARLIVTTLDLRGKFFWENCPRIILADQFSEDYDEREIWSGIPSPANLAYVMYTSGSTGQPKGVEISHLSATQALLAHDEHIPTFHRFLQFAAPTFDVFVFEMFFPLYRGKTLVGCDRTELLRDLPAMITLLSVDAAELTPTVVGTLIQTRTRVPKLKVLLTIGEMLTRPVLDEFGDTPSKKGILHGMYGPTEATIHCTLATTFSSQFKVGIIGVPLGTVSCLIVASQASGEVSPDIEVLPLGHIGELAIAGLQVADGYINRPEQTASAFVETRLYGRVYRTGDKARLLPGGVFECLGRMNSGQVKLRGQRIELGEIEQVAYQMEGIRSATAVVVGAVVVLFCVAGNPKVTSADVWETCRRWLPGFVVPGDVVLLKDVPRLPSGKVDALKLRAEYEKEIKTSSSIPRNEQTEMEAKIGKAIQDVLGLSLDLSVNLAAAGLDSLSAIRLASRLRSVNINIGVVDILKANTIKRIVEASRPLESLTRSSNSRLPTGDWVNVREDVLSELQSRLSESEYSSINDVIPCTPLQIAMLAETKANHQAYCNWVELECLDSVKLDQVQLAFIHLADRNEILRTGFAQSGNQLHPFVQVIWSNLSEFQISQSSSSKRSFRIQTADEFLKPLRVHLRSFGGISRILVQLHHALCDGWSWEHVVSDLDLILRKQPLRPRCQFRELVSFYNHPSTLAKLALSKDYWQTHLQDASSCRVPNLHGKTDIEPGLGVSTFALTTCLADLVSTSRNLGVSPQALFQAAFAWLLGMYIGSSDVIMGTVSSGRTLPVPGIEDIIGPCFATLPLRLDVAHSRTAQDLIQAVHRLNRELLEHHELPLQEIKKICGIAPGLPLFDAMLIWQQTLQERSPELVTQVDAKDYLECNLTLEVNPNEGAFQIKANYQRSVFPESQMTIFLRQMDHLIIALTSQPFTLLTELSHHLDDELLSFENPSPEHHQNPAGLSQTVELLAHNEPTRIAIEFVRELNGPVVEAERVSYHSLNVRANQLAHYLLQRDISSNELVCICLGKSVDLYISILGVVKVGAGYLAMTPETPVNRLRAILTDSKVKFCITHSSLAGQSNEDLQLDINEPFYRTRLSLTEPRSEKQTLLTFPPSVKLLFMDRVDLNCMPASNPTCVIRPSDPAYAVFTSGTTGAAKGVLITQGNLVSNLRVLADIYPVPEGSRLLQSCSQAFDVSVFEIFFAWFTGMCLCSATQDVLFRDLENAIRAMNITHLSLTPTVAALVEPRNVPAVKFLVTAGEALTDKVFNNWSGKGLYQGYGPSETTNICTLQPLVTSSDAINKIGPPLPNTSAFVMQGAKSLTLTPRGAIGEFCFGGDQVFHGYLNMPVLNAQKIIEHPRFGRLYRSGDFGRILWNGALEYFGRQDDQVKIRGQRVELGEINNVLLKSPGVLDVCTFIDQIKPTVQRLLTFWVPKGCSTLNWRILDIQDVSNPTFMTLFSDLEASLPSYMIPSLLVPISYIPMTAQGKIDRRRLIKALSKLDRDSVEQFSQPFEHNLNDQEWSQLERNISNILCVTIKCAQEDVGRRTSFFSLGLDSISAVSFAKSLREQGFQMAEASIILRHSTVLTLAKKLTEEFERSVADKRSRIAVRDVFDHSETESIRKRFDETGRHVNKILPCTPLQEAMLASVGSRSVNSYYNHTVFEIHGDLDRLQKAWESMVLKHDILRTSFTTTRNGRYSYAQVILSAHPLNWATVNVGNEDLDSALDRRIDLVTKTLDELDPPYSFTAFRSTNKKFILFSMHHALYDGEAIELLLGEVKKAYDSHVTPSAILFEGFLQLALSLNLEEADLFWNKQLAAYKPKLFPYLSLKPVDPGDRGPGNFMISRSSSTSLNFIETYCRKHSLSQLGLFQASWARLLSLYLNTEDVCFGNVVSGRSLPMDGIERLVAPCFNTIPVRLQLTSNISNIKFIKHVQQQSFDTSPFQFTPLRRIRGADNTERERLFDTLFILQKPKVSGENHIWTVRKDIGAIDFPLVCEIIPMKDKNVLQFILHTQSNLESAGYTSSILETLDAIMQACIQFPSALVSDYGFLDKSLLQKATRASVAASDIHDRNLSISVEKNDVESSKSYWTNEQKEMLDILAKLSQQNPNNIGLQTTIFRLGLDSISAVQIAANLRAKGRNVSPIEILEHPSIEKLTLHLQAKTRVRDEDCDSFDFDSYNRKYKREVCLRHSINKLDLAMVRPCTPVQSGMLATFLSSEGSRYFNSIELEVPEDDDSLNKLRTSWVRVVEKHELLRTGFSTISDVKHPFAMLTYNKDSLDSDFEILEEELSHGKDALQAQIQLNSKSVLLALHLPPWRLIAIRRRNNVWAIRLFMLHAIFDAISLKVILSDLAKSYRGQSLSPGTPINPLLESILIESSADGDERKLFWQQATMGATVTRFPSTTPLRVESTQMYSIQKDCRLSLEQIQRKCKDLDVTVQAAGQASWARILSIYTGEATVIFGSVLSGRSNLEFEEPAAFPTVVTLPICVNIQGSNRELLDGLTRNQSSLLKHQFTPVSKIQRWTDHNDGPLFDTLFAYQNMSSYETTDSGSWLVANETATAEYSISIELIPVQSRASVLQLRLAAREDILPQGQASMLIEQLESMLIDTITFPDQNSYDMTSYPKNLLSITPAKQNSIPSSTILLHQFVESQTIHRPQKVALEFATSLTTDRRSRLQWTYHELDVEGNKVAHLLDQMRIEPRSMIAICFRKCPEASFATLGVLKAGCAFVAIDPDAPIDRQRFIVDDSKSSLVLAAKDTAKTLEGQLQVPVIALDDINLFKKQSLSKESRGLAEVLSGSDLCYCLYTSGTSGTPKACLISHENAVQAILAFQRLFRDRWVADSRWLQFASFHFDVSILEQFWSWSVGICVTSAPRDLIFEDIAGAIRVLGITHLDLTPSLARTLHPNDVPSLWKGVFITGGEQLQQEIIDLWGPKECIYNGYGPTETTIGNTMFPRVPKNGKPSNIGWQFDNVGTYIFRDGTTSPVLRGAVGELCIAGKLVSPGYLNRDDLNKQKFPYLEEYGERVYRTGDLVRIQYDGTFDFIGRADDQVKLRGQRLEIAEINQVIKKGVKSIRDVATLVIKHVKSGRMQLVSFFEPSSAKERGSTLCLLKGDEPCEIALGVKEACQEKLPPYMIPTHFIPVNRIPLSSNNKVESNQLKAFYNRISASELQSLTISPYESQSAWSDTERRIVALLTDATGVNADLIMRSSSIFRLGLDSISIINFARALKHEGFANAQIPIIMQNPVVSQLAKALAGSPLKRDSQSAARLQARQNIEAFRLRHLSAVCRVLEISIDSVEGFAPCTPLQEGIISRSLSSNTPLYFENFTFELAPETDIAQLKSAWTKVVDSTQILRTRFCPTVDGYAQVVCKNIELSWHEKYFVAEEKLDAFKAHRYDRWWNENRELNGRMFEILILRCGTRNSMYLHIFHALYDGLSLPLILEKVSLVYHCAANVKYGPPFMEALPFGPLCEVEGAREFWAQSLKSVISQPKLALTGSDSRGTSSATSEIPLLSINEIRRYHNTTHQSLIQAAWIMILRKNFPLQNTFGMIVSGRAIDFEDIELVMGPLFNTIPFCPKIEGCKSWSDVIERCHEFNVTALPFQHCSLREITKWCQRSSENPIVETLFMFQQKISGSYIDSDKLWRQVETAPHADYALSFEALLSENEETLSLTIVAQDSISDEENLLNMLEDFRTAWSEIATDASKPPLNIKIELHDANVAPQELSGRPDEGNTPIVLGENTDIPWTIDACTIRDEIVMLAECAPSVLTPQISIFALGLDSIDAVKLSSRLKRRGINLSVSMIMRNPYLTQMTQLASKVAKNAIEGSKIHLDEYEGKLRGYLQSNGFPSSTIEAVLPPTPLQEAMIAGMSISKYSRYFNHDLLVLELYTDPEKLKLAWISVVENSPIFRTSFLKVDDPSLPMSYAQVVHHPGSSWLRSVEAGPNEDFNITFRELIEQDKAKAVNDVPFALTFVRGKDRTHMVLSLSHALYDGWSLTLLHSDVHAAYNGSFSPRSSYRQALEHILNSSGSEASSYWTNYISGARSCSFPQRPGASEFYLQVHRLQKNSSISASAMKIFLRRQGITAQALGQTCWALVLGSYMKSLEVVFGVVLSGRDTEESSQLMFPTMNTVVVRSVIHGSAKQMLQDMQDSCANATQFQHFPLRKVLAAARKSDSKLFDSLFILQKRPLSAIAGGSLYTSIGGDSNVDFSVCVELELGEDTLLWRTACNDLVLDRCGTENLLERLEYILRHVIQSLRDTTVEMTGEGIAICGLQAFHLDRETTHLDHPSPAHTPEDWVQWNNTELAIRKVLSDVSHIPETEIRKDQTIFSLGLDSISTIKVSSILRKSSVNLSVSEMLKASTITEMALVVGEKAIESIIATQDSKGILLEQLAHLQGVELTQNAGINADKIEKFLPCSPGQVYMLSIWQNSGGRLFHSRFHYETPRRLDEVRLTKAWEVLCEKSPILRTAFAPTGDRKVPFLQVILKENLNPVIWLSEFPFELDTSLELDKPLVSLAILPTKADTVNGRENTNIFLNIHHALYDGVSLDILVQQLQALYQDPRATFSAELQFEDFLAQTFTEPHRRLRKEFWSTYLDKADNSLLPPAFKPSKYARKSQFAPNLLPSTEKLLAASKRHNISIQALFFAAYARVHASLLPRLGLPAVFDLILGIYLANRSLPLNGLPTLTAPTVNFVPLRILVATNTSLIDSATQVQRDLHAVASMQATGVGLWEVDDWTGVRVDCFVNFLTVPGKGEGVNVREDGWVEVKDTGIEGDYFGGNAETGSVGGGNLIGLAEQRARNAVADVYRESVDVEAAIRHDGALDVGIWFPESLRGVQYMEELLEELRVGLEGI